MTVNEKQVGHLIHCVALVLEDWETYNQMASDPSVFQKQLGVEVDVPPLRPIRWESLKHLENVFLQITGQHDKEIEDQTGGATGHA